MGASAGGLEAFRQFIETIPYDSEMAYVIVQHLHPLHDTMLTELLSRVTKGFCCIC
ncbi:chemotaxis protein CheB [Flavobacterium pectinovorum]|uniref:chemotaxis protein CheB n=1 Tax=Flavobacterium pectinovorum TaxID=29533 RepID=UPI003977B4B8